MGMKMLLVLMVLMVVAGIAVLLVRRLSEIARQVASLRDDLKRNEAKLTYRLHSLQEAAENSSQNGNTPPKED